MKEHVKNLFSSESQDTKNNTYSNFIYTHRLYLLIYPLLVIAVFNISSFFINSGAVRLIISLLLSFIPCKELVRKIRTSSHKHIRTQVLVLLQVLTTSVSSGYSLEKSLTLIRPVIEHTFGHKCPLIKPLIELENNIKIHMDIEKALGKFASGIDLPEVVPVFHALAISSKIGNNSLAILRSSCQMLSEINAVQNEIAAANAGKNAEAVMLCIMPFAITMALDKMGGGYLSTARQSRVGQILLIVALVVGIISSAMLLRFMTHSDNKNKRRKRNSIDDQVRRVKTPLTDIIKKIMPASFISYRHELFNELSLDANGCYERYLKQQVTTAAVTFLFSSIIVILTGNSMLIPIALTILIVFAKANDVRKNVEFKKEEMMKDIPLFLCLACTLLEAGLQLPKTIDICSIAFKDNNSLSDEIRGMRAMMLSGRSASDAVEQFSLRIQIPEAQAAFLLVARYGRLGSKEVLNLLSLQSSSCWDICRNASRKKQEREALSMLFPMTLDFVCVLIVATTPAIISLGI